MDGVFEVYARLGFEHILDPEGYDHILFLAALCAVYRLSMWRELLVLVTAFTVGHSVSLALATVGVVEVDSGWVEFLIPVTIVMTALANVLVPPRPADQPSAQAAPLPRVHPERLLKYGLAVVFGIIHGLGFSNFLRLVLGNEERLLGPLLSFNIGLELGQILIAAGVLGIGAVARLAGLKDRSWTFLVSGAAGLVALFMALSRIP